MLSLPSVSRASYDCNCAYYNLALPSLIIYKSLMNQDNELPIDTQNQIKALQLARKAYLPAGYHPEYGQITAKIPHLRHGNASLYQWRKANAGRIKYERSIGLAYVSLKRTKPLTEEQREARNAACRKHSKSHPERKIRQNIERCLHHLYRECSEGQSVKRRKRCEELLGCSTVAFREHIRAQLARNGWLWSQWKEVWTIDHVVPVRKFDLPREEKACWHYTNLRPLAKAQNHRSQRS